MRTDNVRYRECNVPALPGRDRSSAHVSGNFTSPDRAMLSAAALSAGETAGDPQSCNEAIGSDNAAERLSAIQAEYVALIARDTWEPTLLPAGRKAIRCKRIIKVRYHSDGTARHFQGAHVLQRTLSDRRHRLRCHLCPHGQVHNTARTTTAEAEYLALSMAVQEDKFLY